MKTHLLSPTSVIHHDSPSSKSTTLTLTSPKKVQEVQERLQVISLRDLDFDFFKKDDDDEDQDNHHANTNTKTPPSTPQLQSKPKSKVWETINKFQSPTSASTPSTIRTRNTATTRNSTATSAAAIPAIPFDDDIPKHPGFTRRSWTPKTNQLSSKEESITQDENAVAAPTTPKKKKSQKDKNKTPKETSHNSKISSPRQSYPPCSSSPSKNKSIDTTTMVFPAQKKLILLKGRCTNEAIYMKKQRRAMSLLLKSGIVPRVVDGSNPLKLQDKEELWQSLPKKLQLELQQNPTYPLFFLEHVSSGTRTERSTTLMYVGTLDDIEQRQENGTLNALVQVEEV